MNLGLFVLTLLLIPFYYFSKHWFIYLYYVVGICWSVAFALLYLVTDPVGIKNTAILIILIVLCTLGCSKLLLYFYKASTKVRSLKEYALEYMVFALIIIGCFALNYDSINRKAYIFLQNYHLEPSIKNTIKLNDYLNRFGFISEQSSYELQKALLEKPAQVYKEDFQFKSSFFDMFYFSTVSYLTVGYGDYLPSGWLVRFLVLLEVFIGHISTAIVLVIGVAKIIKN